MAATVSLGRPWVIEYFPSSLFETNTIEKSSNNRVAWRFFALTPSMIRRIIKMSYLVDQFSRKPF